VGISAAISNVSYELGPIRMQIIFADRSKPILDRFKEWLDETWRGWNIKRYKRLN
jgi:hypothetical protein